MNAQPRPTMTADEFKAWRARMNYTQGQAAHVLMVTPTTVASYESGSTPVDPHVAHVAESAELLRTLDSGTFFGNALGMIQRHHAKLRKRMEEAAAMQVRRPRTLRETGFYEVPQNPLTARIAYFESEIEAIRSLIITSDKGSGRWLHHNEQLKTLQMVVDQLKADLAVDAESDLGVSDEELRARGIIPAGAQTVGGMRFTKPSGRSEN